MNICLPPHYTPKIKKNKNRKTLHISCNSFIYVDCVTCCIYTDTMDTTTNHSHLTILNKKKTFCLLCSSVYCFVSEHFSLQRVEKLSRYINAKRNSTSFVTVTEV